MKDQPWRFQDDVRHVGGPDGDWLRQELAGVVRELLLWAREDLADTGEDQAAA